MFTESIFCVVLKKHKVVGYVKVTRNKNIALTMQTLFNFCPEVFEQDGIQSIWHSGRFALVKSEKEGAKLLRKLITMAIYPIYSEPNSIMLAECDSKFVKVLNLIGIKTEVLAHSIHYLPERDLGKETDIQIQEPATRYIFAPGRNVKFRKL